MKRTPPVKLSQAQIGSALRKLKLKQGRSRRVACRVIAAWLKTRVEPELPERENLTDSQLPYHRSYRGLDAALKTWATHRNKGARKSLFLRGLLREHPEWQ